MHCVPWQGDWEPGGERNKRLEAAFGNGKTFTLFKYVPPIFFVLIFWFLVYASNQPISEGLDCFNFDTKISGQT